MKTLRLALTLLVAFICGGLEAKDKEFPFQLGDKMELQISGVSPTESAFLNQAYLVGEDGTVSIQFLGKVAAAGVKPSEFASKIEELFKSKEIYSHPTVRVLPSDISDPRCVYVVSGPAKPILIPIHAGMTVSQVLVAASGSIFSSVKKVKLKRKGQAVRTLDLSKAGSADGDVLVEPEDEIVVPN